MPVIREATSLDDLTAMHAVFAAQWGADGVPQPNVLRAVEHAGGYAVVAEEDGRIVGGSLGWLGRTADGVPLLHSHITGTLPEAMHRGIGFAIKQHQREWCLARGIEVVEWTFDPLVRRNAYFNLTKLGAVATEYHANFYGPMDDALNAGDETDRLVATWHLLGPRVDADVEGPLVLDVDEDGAPVVHDVDGDSLRFRLPAESPAPRRAWRLALRDTLGAAIERGHVAVAVTRDGCYVTTRSS